MPKSPFTAADGSGADLPLGIGALRVRIGDHIGHFFHSEEEWRRVLVGFLAAGLAAGEKCVLLLGAVGAPSDIERDLADNGVDAGYARQTGQLIVDHGRGSPQEMRAQLEEVLSDIPERYPMLRWVADMTWSLKKLPTSEALMEWESHCNVVESPPAVFLCQYHLAAFNGTVMMDALKTHPTCIVSNAVHVNPYYQEPAAFLEELRGRPDHAGW